MTDFRKSERQKVTHIHKNVVTVFVHPRTYTENNITWRLVFSAMLGKSDY